jgi:hypothetical protein
MHAMDMATQVIVLLIYFLGVGLCLWRPATWWNRVALSVIAAGLWTGLFVFMPRLRVWLKAATQSTLYRPSGGNVGHSFGFAHLVHSQIVTSTNDTGRVAETQQAHKGSFVAGKSFSYLT